MHCQMSDGIDALGMESLESLDFLAMDIDITDTNTGMSGEPSLEFLLKPLTASHVRRAFRGRKSLALMHSFDDIVYRNIKRVFKYKEFEKEWQHIASNEQRLMQRAATVIERRKRHKARALARLKASSSSSSSRRRRSGSSKKSGAAPIRPLRSSRSSSSKVKALAKETNETKDTKGKKDQSIKASSTTEPKPRAIKPSTARTSNSSSTAKRASEAKAAKVASVPATARSRQTQKASETKFKVINGCYYFYPSVTEKEEQNAADGYDTLSSSNSNSVSA